MKIYIVRHGEAAASWGESTDPGLSALGHQQATAAAARLLPILDHSCDLISSPLLRAQETATPLSEALALAVTIDPTFKEIPSPVPLTQRQDWLRGFMTQSWPEQPAELSSWKESILQRLVALQKPTVIFSHFLVINTVVGAINNKQETLSFMPDNGSITILELEEGELQVVDYGKELETKVNL